MITTFRFLLLFTLPVAWASAGLTPAELTERLREDPPVVLIDIRSGDLYREHHIPGALNLSPRTLNPRRLPAGRTPVLYDDGLGRHDARAAVETLHAAGRTDARYLSGGLAAWESHHGTTTAPVGMQSDRVPGITYDKLIETGGRDVAILDLRTVPELRMSMSDEPGAAPPPAGPTDLNSLLPAARVLPAPAAAPPSSPVFATLSDAPTESLPRVAPTDELIVVIDDGDGSGEEIVRRLRASGNRRVVLLTGGEEILRHQGRPGLERTGRGTQSIPANNEGGDQ